MSVAAKGQTRSGWQVTAVDISDVALERAAAKAPAIADRITWTCADLIVSSPSAGLFDLVSVQYFPLMRQPDDAALRGLLDAVAAEGTLLFATHHPAELSDNFNASDFYHPDDILGFLANDWVVIVNETRPRVGATPAGTHHTRNLVLRIQRRS